MDGKQFDTIAVLFARTVSRRAGAKALAGGALGALLGARGAPEAAACKALQTSCAEAGECCQDGGATDCAATSRGSGFEQRCGTGFSDRCCRPVGGACTSECDCCGTVDCVGGTCGGTCKALRRSCATRAECCPIVDFRTGARTQPQCRSTGRGEGFLAACSGRDVCCLGLGKRCGGDCDCCGNVPCRGGLCQCPADQKPCAGYCIPQGDCCANADCGGGGLICQGGTCRCPTGREFCDGAAKCVDKRTDPDHCGRCDRPCPPGRVCLNGECRCPDGRATGCCIDADCDGRECRADGTCGPCERGSRETCYSYDTFSRLSRKCGCCPNDTVFCGTGTYDGIGHPRSRCCPSGSTGCRTRCTRNEFDSSIECTYQCSR